MASIAVNQCVDWNDHTLFIRRNSRKGSLWLSDEAETAILPKPVEGQEKKTQNRNSDKQ
jgi:hypothetical protein